MTRVEGCLVPNGVPGLCLDENLGHVGQREDIVPEAVVACVDQAQEEGMLLADGYELRRVDSIVFLGVHL